MTKAITITYVCIIITTHLPFHLLPHQISRSETSLTIEWKKPYHNGAVILSYNIDVSGRKMLSYVPEMSENDNSDNTSDGNTLIYTIVDLQPNTQYRYK